MDRPITRAQFLSVNRDKTIETAPIYGKPDIPEKVQAAFVRADLNADGRIAGDREMSALFSAIDTFDTDGNCHSVRARAKSLALVERGAQSPSGQASTPSTRLKALLRARPALKTHQDMIRLCLSIGQGDWQLGQRVAQTFGLDLNRLTDNRSAILSGASATSPTTSRPAAPPRSSSSSPNAGNLDLGRAGRAPSGHYGRVYRHHTALLNNVRSWGSDTYTRGIEFMRRCWGEGRNRYDHVSSLTGIPAKLIAALHYRESSCKFNTYLHQGDELGRPARRHPADIPTFHEWEPAAVHALGRMKHVRDALGITADTTDVAALATYAEHYNGLGYYNRDVVTPYVYAGTDVYNGGRYVSDGVYDPRSWEKRPGVVPILVSLLE